MRIVNQIRFRLLGVAAGVLLCTLAFLGRPGQQPAAPVAREMSGRRRQAASGGDAASLVRFYEREIAECQLRVAALEFELSNKLAALEANPTNKVLAEEARKLSREVEFESVRLARMNEGLRFPNEPELGGSCVFPLPGHLK